MRKVFMKLLSIFLLFMAGFLVYSYYTNQKKIKENIATEILGLEEQTISEEELIIEKIPEEKIVGNGTDYVSVPYYWKTGINTDEKDPLNGYIPNIKTFRQYFSTNQAILFGSVDEDYELINKDYIVLSDDNYIYSNGIENGSEYFEWNEKICSSKYSLVTETNIFVCDNWVNWLGIPILEKTFVLTRCNINDNQGYCVFEDYLYSYYESKTMGENRCFGEDNEYICNYNDYIRLVNYN